jgi:predicted amidohydrolase YtcJ
LSTRSMLTWRQLLGALAALSASFALFYPTVQTPHAGEAPDGETACPLGFGKRGDTDPHVRSFHTSGSLGAGDGPAGFHIARVFLNATIWTGDGLVPFADAMAVTSSGRILAVGTEKAVLAAAGSDAPKVSLHGRFVIPGIQDAHLHLVSGGFRLNQLDLSRCVGKDDFIRQTRKFAAALDAAGDDTSWVLGGGWDESRWDPPGVLPSKEWLTEALATTKNPHRPVWLLRADAHAGVASLDALALAQIDAQTTDPPGGVIGRFPDSNTPDGLVKENAIALIASVIPKPDPHARIAAFKLAFQFLLQNGITAVSDFGDVDALAGSFVANSTAARTIWGDFELLEALDLENKLSIRVSAYAPLADWERTRDHKKRGWFEDRTDGAGGSPGRVTRFRVAGCKAFIDGSLGARTAWFADVYDDDPRTKGEPVCGMTIYEKRVLKASRAGLQVATHAIGDAAVFAAARAAEKALLATRGSRSDSHPNDAFRIEHAQHLPLPVDEAAQLFAETGIIASVQPTHMLLDAFIAEKRLGQERALKGGYAFKSLLDRNVPLAFGSDWPIADVNPFVALRAAVERKERGSDAEPWDQAQQLTPEQALRAYTAGSARASCTSGLLGTLWRGGLADFVVLDSLEIQFLENDALPKVLATYVDGVCVYGADGAAECVE